MANVSFPRGLFPVRPYRRVTYYVANTITALYLYQPVVLESAGIITRATCGSAYFVLGAVIGFADSNGGHLKRELPYMQKTDGDGKPWVAVTDHPEQEYILEAETGDSATLNQSNIGNLADFTYLATTGNTTTGISTACLDASGVQASSGQFFLIGLQAAAAGENAYGNYAKWRVLINMHQRNSVTGLNSSGGV